MFFTITAKFSEPLWLGEIFPTASNTLLQVYRIYLWSTPKAFSGTGNVATWNNSLEEIFLVHWEKMEQTRWMQAAWWHGKRRKQNEIEVNPGSWQRSAKASILEERYLKFYLSLKVEKLYISMFYLIWVYRSPGSLFKEGKLNPKRGKKKYTSSYYILNVLLNTSPVLLYTVWYTCVYVCVHFIMQMS